MELHSAQNIFRKKLHPNISKQVLEYHKAVINEVEEAIAEKQIVIVGMRWNDAVWQARRNFRKAGKKVCGVAMKYQNMSGRTHQRILPNQIES